MMRKDEVKNTALLSLYVISMIPSIFYGSSFRLNLGLLVERSTRIDFFATYYVTAIQFIILAYCVHFPKGINKRVSNLILTISVIDLIHLMLLAGQGFGLTKIGIAVVIVFRNDIIAFIKNPANEIDKWQH